MRKKERGREIQDQLVKDNCNNNVVLLFFVFAFFFWYRIALYMSGLTNVWSGRAIRDVNQMAADGDGGLT